jgi:hypothetical protein
VFGFEYSGFPPGLDYSALIALPDGSLVTGRGGAATPQGTIPQASGCLYFTVPASALQQATMPAGSYQLQLLAGPSLTPVGKTATLTITAPGRGAA